MMYVSDPMPLRNVGDLLFERRIDFCKREDQLLVEQVRSHVCERGEAPAVKLYARSPTVALARQRGLREDRRRDALPGG
jgi:hypothetical protein